MRCEWPWSSGGGARDGVHRAMMFAMRNIFPALWGSSAAAWVYASNARGRSPNRLAETPRLYQACTIFLLAGNQWPKIQKRAESVTSGTAGNNVDALLKTCVASRIFPSSRSLEPRRVKAGPLVKSCPTGMKKIENVVINTQVLRHLKIA
jgi:hypothetical protein